MALASSVPEQGHVLLVDDDERLRKLMARYLTEHGFMVTVAASAADGGACALAGAKRAARQCARSGAAIAR
jgi:DNA-binding response OmpR family regulator